jgi:hypothetical protein
MLRFERPDCFLEIDGAEEDSPSLQSHGDARLTVRVRSAGFSGDAAAWVSRSAIAAFGRDLAALNASLRGEAVLSSISPGELQLKVFSVSSRGHLAVQGSVEHQVVSENRDFRHSVSFGFEFENSQLELACRTSWLPRESA